MLNKNKPCCMPKNILELTYIIIPSQQRWRGYSNAAIRGKLAECVGAWVCAGYRLQFLPDHFQTSQAHCWWEEEPYWFWVTWSKVKVNFGTLCIKPCGHDTDNSFCPIIFKLHAHCGWWEEGLFWFRLAGSKVKVNFSTLCIKPCGTIQTTVFAQSLSNFTCKLWMMRGGTLLI